MHTHQRMGLYPRRYHILHHSGPHSCKLKVGNQELEDSPILNPNNIVDEVNDDRGECKGMFLRVSGIISSTVSVSLRSSSPPIFRISPLSLNF